MKTFKLKLLEIIEQRDDSLMPKKIPLKDGLAINREDDNNQWVIEAFIDYSYLDYFNDLKKENEIVVQVKITKESNEPATFITSIIGVNEIGEHMNVLFLGSIVDRRINKVEDILTALIDEGYQGKDLITKFKEVIAKKLD
ncbi:YwpF family protein [Virgibacillus natechei]|uniref:YwpF family protein n=1 Tax=Virgibacillus sp. CBA3643 TaxID=2942278 RepID=UPI0035A3B62B